MRQSRRNILLHRRPCRNDEFFAERLVVIGDDFGQRILFVCRSFVVVDIGIEQRRHMQLGCLLLEQVIIVDSFRNGTRQRNYEGMIVKLMKGSAVEKSNSLKKFIFLYENARSRIYLYERRITECLELLLLM